MSLLHALILSLHEDLLVAVISFDEEESSNSHSQQTQGQSYSTEHCRCHV
uniref:Uncharacterized protein n=1 Tax=Anguilla anguilla TaxID=7936 RepID=A0A0E9Y170_ANGAN